MAFLESPAKGGFPQSIIYVMIPRDQTSHLISYFYDLMTSGAVYRGLPNDNFSSLPGSMVHANPKSVTLTTISLVCLSLDLTI